MFLPEKRRDFLDSESQETLTFLTKWADNANFKDSILVLDLDSTLFDTSLRTAKIFSHLAHDDELDQKDSQLCQKIKNWKCLQEVYDPIEFVEKHTNEHPIEDNLKKFLKDYWHQRFFHPDWFEHDRLFEGANEVIQELSQKVQIGYLTGRSNQALRKTTIQQLRDHRFPLENDENLIMKPSGKLPDIKFKDTGLQEFQSRYSNIAYIENEVELVTMSLEKHANIQTILFDSVHSGRGTLKHHQPRRLRSWKT